MMLRKYSYFYAVSTFSLLFALEGCRNRTPPPEPETQASASLDLVSSTAATASPIATNASTSTAPGASSATTATSASTTPDSIASVQSSSATPPGSDPEHGEFTLEEALKGLPKSGKLYAEIQTDQGKLKCELYEDKAPVTVANFVGLARGLRPFKDPKTHDWVKRPAYDDGVFHRIIKGFMIQGGDPTGTGAGDGGYVFKDEVWPGATHDRRGLICMANRGANTNSMQFFIMDGPAPHLDRGYTIFGSCGPDATIEKLASSEVRGDRAVNPPKIKKVTIKRAK